MDLEVSPRGTLTEGTLAGWLYNRFHVMLRFLTGFALAPSLTVMSCSFENTILPCKHETVVPDRGRDVR